MSRRRWHHVTYNPLLEFAYSLNVDAYNLPFMIIYLAQFFKSRPTFRFQGLTVTTSPPSFDMVYWKMSADISGKIRNVGRHFGEMSANISGKLNVLIDLKS